MPQMQYDSSDSSAKYSRCLSVVPGQQKQTAHAPHIVYIVLYNMLRVQLSFLAQPGLVFAKSAGEAVQRHSVDLSDKSWNKMEQDGTRSLRWSLRSRKYQGYPDNCQ